MAGGGPGAVQVESLKTADSIQVAITAAMTDAMLVESQLKTTGLLGQVTFTLPDQSAIQCGLLLELGNICGPWDHGPIDVAVQDGSATLTNMITGAVNVTDLMVYGPTGTGTPVAVDATLGDPQTVSLPDGGGDLYPVYAVQPGTVERLQEIRSFVEDVHTNVIFLNLINYGSHALKKLSIVARLKDITGTYPLDLNEGGEAQADMILPLTNYVGSRILQYQVLKTHSDDSITTTDWISWDMEKNGNIVSMQWNDITQDLPSG